MKETLSKDRLIKILIIVSIITVSFIGIKTLGELSTNFFQTLGNAIKSVMIPFSIAFLLSFIIGPFAKIIEKKTNLNRTLSVIVGISLGIFFVVGILSITLTFIISQLTIVVFSLLDFVDDETIKRFIESVAIFLEHNLAIDNFESLVNSFQNYGLTPEVVAEWFGSLIGIMYNLTSSIISIGFIIILTPVFMYYLIKDREQVFRGILYVFPKKVQGPIETLGKESDQVIRGYFIGHGMVMAFITIFFMITYSILAIFIPGFNVGHAILFALVMGLFSIIPYLGVWISMAMPIVMFTTLHFETDNPGYIFIIGVIMILVLNIIEEILESTLVQPNVFSKQVKIHPIAVLSSFIFFGAIFGLVGFILAVPLAGTIKVTLAYFKTNNEVPKEPQKNA